MINLKSRLYLLNIGVEGSPEKGERVVIPLEDAKEMRKNVRTYFSSNFLNYETSSETPCEIYLYKGGIIKVPLEYYTSLTQLVDNKWKIEEIKKPIEEMPSCLSLVHEKEWGLLSLSNLMGMVRGLAPSITLPEFVSSVITYTRPRIYSTEEIKYNFNRN